MESQPTGKIFVSQPTSGKKSRGYGLDALLKKAGQFNRGLFNYCRPLVEVAICNYDAVAIHSYHAAAAHDHASANADGDLLMAYAKRIDNRASSAQARDALVGKKVKAYNVLSMLVSRLNPADAQQVRRSITLPERPVEFSACLDARAELAKKAAGEKASLAPISQRKRPGENE